VNNQNDSRQLGVYVVYFSNEKNDIQPQINITLKTILVLFYIEIKTRILYLYS